ncbi:hypothetical protein [Maridesulfovibrio frigidus]|uniref:hypothetical protein n=1 Tax=Maridesulfovibrio frigidus TaxID=340956 RepID=UPI0004E1C27E|nr:hypothetical protein [Maridesulfovibrio frigidus]
MSENFIPPFLPKGMFWAIPNVEELPEIDFDGIGKKNNLDINENICFHIKGALAEYISQVRSFGNRPPRVEQIKQLKKVEKACKLIRPFLELDTPGVLDAGEYDQVKQFLYECVIPKVGCFIDDELPGSPRLIIKENERGPIKLEGKCVADYLGLCVDRIQQELSTPAKRGRRENFQIRRCLISLHQCYFLAGGDGRGAERNGRFKGPFLTFAKMLLDYTKVPLGLTDDPYAESTLGTLVINKYQLK